MYFALHYRYIFNYFRHSSVPSNLRVFAGTDQVLSLRLPIMMAVMQFGTQELENDHPKNLLQYMDHFPAKLSGNFYGDMLKSEHFITKFWTLKVKILLEKGLETALEH